MQKIIFFTDVHDTSRTPRYRKDNFHETILCKLKWIGQYAADNDADIVFGGDFFNTPGVSNSTVGDVLKVLSGFDRPIYAIAGNHDLYGNNSFNVEKTGIGLLIASDYVRNISDHWTRLGDVNLYGLESRMGIDSNAELHLNLPNVPSDGINILVSHSMILQKKKNIMSCIGIEELENCPADIILSGHDHAGFGVIHKGNKYFCNPGALGRVTTSTSDVNLQVKIAEIVIDNEGVFSVRLVPLPEDIAKPASEVLDVETAHQEKEAMIAAQQWTSKMGRVNSVGVLNEEQLVDKFIAELGFAKTVKDLFYQYFGEAKEQMKNGEDTSDIF